jgi:tetratricopeptide (TPR) repeat protein
MGMGGMGMGGMGMMGMGGGGSFQGSFNGGLGAVGATQAAGLITIITRIVDPGNWNQPTINAQAVGIMGGFPMFMGGFGGMGFMGGFGGMGFMGGFMGAPGMGMNMGAGPPPDPNINVDPQTSNSIDFFPPALAIIVRAPSRVHTSITGGIVGGKGKRLEAAAWREIEEREKVRLAKADNKNDTKVQEFGDKIKLAREKREVLDPTTIWQEAFDKGGIDAAHVIATADFLFEAGQPKHAAEFLKANLRHGVVVRPWVFEALAVALEASGGAKEEIRRARLSGIALDPTDAQGFMSAARAMADRGQFDRALAFCKQAAQLEPADYHSYEVALAYAENAKDAKAMEWAVGNLVSQDWPVDNLLIQGNAQKRLGSLAATLKSEKRGQEADSLETALARLNQRDMIMRLEWDTLEKDVCELELKVKEPSSSVCNLDQKQSPGGGVMIGYNLLKTPSCQYVAAQAFSGEYEVTVTRLYGRPLNNRARLIVTANAGTKDEVRRVEIVQLDKTTTFKVKLKDGRRTELATVSPAAQRGHEARGQQEANAFRDLRAIANPNFYGAAGPRGSAGTPGLTTSVAAMAAKDSKNKTAPTTVMQNSINPTGGAVQMTAQVRLNHDQRNYDMVIRPFFDAAALRTGRPAVNLSAIPGGAN